MENAYYMTSIETDMDFVDRMADEYEESYQMSDEEQKGFEEHITEENNDEEVLYEVTEDTAINFAFDTLFGMSREESTKNRKAVKKAQVDKSLSVPRGVVSVQEVYAQKLANKLNSEGVK